MGGAGKGGGQKKADVLLQKSPAEFFAENKNIAGFDNVSKLTFWRNANSRSPSFPREL